MKTYLLSFNLTKHNEQPIGARDVFAPNNPEIFFTKSK